ncbi:MAG: hypothetical protein KGL00_05350 [Gammaproteobacteria bacterium]|nr:hypothetical protein [Gammaproteobacteria bacterium]
MNVRRRFKYPNTILLAFTLLLPPLVTLAGETAQNPASPSEQDGAPVMHLGKVEVKGEKQIIQTLQLIKVALRTPESSDPKLANVVICRLHDEIGSHERQILTCGTNASLAARRDATQTAMRWALSNPGPPGGTPDSAAFELNQMLANQPGNILHAPVNGPAFRSLLEKIPLPVSPRQAPHAATRP